MIYHVLCFNPFHTIFWNLHIDFVQGPPGSHREGVNKCVNRSNFLFQPIKLNWSEHTFHLFIFFLLFPFPFLLFFLFFFLYSDIMILKRKKVCIPFTKRMIWTSQWKSTKSNFIQTTGPRCIKLFARLFFCHRKTLANLYANCNGEKNCRSFLSFCRKKLRQKFYATGPLSLENSWHHTTSVL